MYFIWYHRVDLNQEWKQVRESFNAQFPNRQRNGFQGIQCKYYRFIKEKKCPTLREQRRIRNGDGGGTKHGPNDDSPAYGVIRWCRRLSSLSIIMRLRMNGLLQPSPIVGISCHNSLFDDFQIYAPE
ncbi:hypothetical protein CIHG_03109 [Coccidioides immitis H538.4]|uniref:Uncharacterized protein n=1 Tax=Coccidioides immitis H538.4 TaxID=396776 RepID=A0A0J8RJI8_COCIT|nr:hypothetical protein CIHG_03109 [Coccidioides immitis H538.4]